jgi:hypothetical protein
MPRFVILEHDHPELHWDLMLERGPVLWTWRLPSPPRLGPSMRVERTFDHRLIYLEYEGPISGDRGAVERWDRGTFSWELETDSRIQVRLDGGKTRGVLRLKLLDGADWDVELVAEGGTPGVGEG